MNGNADYYGVLGVEADASPDDIKLAFRRLAREYHPDATGGNAESEQRYKQVSEAYAVLSDPRKRQEYDAARAGFGTWSSPWGSPFASTIEDIFENFFGGVGRTRTRERTRARRGESVEVELELTLEEVVFGAERTIRFERYEPCEQCEGSGAEPGTEPEACDQCEGTGQVQQVRRTVLGSMVTAYPCRKCNASGWIVRSPCAACRGQGREAKDAEIGVEIPPGLDDGDRLRLTGEGEAGSAGGGRGDLYVRFRIRTDDRFERSGDDLYAWVEIPMTTAALGGKLTVDTLDGSEGVDVPAGTQPNHVFQLRGRGVPRRSGRGRGDLIIRAHVSTPTKLKRKEKELLIELARLRREEEGDEPAPSILRRVLGRD